MGKLRENEKMRRLSKQVSKRLRGTPNMKPRMLSKKVKSFLETPRGYTPSPRLGFNAKLIAFNDLIYLLVLLRMGLQNLKGREGNKMTLKLERYKLEYHATQLQAAFRGMSGRRRLHRIIRNLKSRRKPK